MRNDFTLTSRNKSGEKSRCPWRNPSALHRTRRPNSCARGAAQRTQRPTATNNKLDSNQEKTKLIVRRFSMDYAHQGQRQLLSAKSPRIVTKQNRLQLIASSRLQSPNSSTSNQSSKGEKVIQKEQEKPEATKHIMNRATREKETLLRWEIETKITKIQTFNKLSLDHNWMRYC